MLYDLKIYFLLFMTYSFIGWLIEIIDISIIQKKIVDRGFLIGPYCPVYGIGALLMIVLLDKYIYDPLVLFGMSFLICGVLEYLTSYIMEKIFKTRWWDYSSYKFNLNGRVCLINLVLFGLGGMIVLYIINPFVIDIFSNMSNNILTIITFVLAIIFTIDVCISFKIIYEFKNIATTIRKDSTDEIKEKVKKILKSKSRLYRRLIKAFPNFK